MATSLEKITRIKLLLGVESSDKWIELMDYIYVVLSDVLTVGKPTKSSIENSIIGENGFKSWKEMFTTAQNKGGFGGNYSSYEAWKRAYSIVLKFEYLRDLELTASQINTINRETKPNFPTNSDEFKAILSARGDKQRQMQQNSLKDAQNKNYELEVRITEQNLKLDALRLVHEKNEVLIKEQAVLNRTLGQMQAKIDDRELKFKELSNQSVEIKLLNKDLKKQLSKESLEVKSLNKKLNKYLNMPFVQKILFLFKQI